MKKDAENSFEEAVKAQKETARAVQDGGFEGLEVLVKDLVMEAEKLNRELVESNDPARDLVIKADLRAMKRLISRYVGFLKIDLK